jgi:competence protein ComFC
MLIINFITKIIRIIFPNYCLSCQINIDDRGYFCSDCYRKLKFISDPKCNICSKPIIEHITNRQQEIICIDCIANKPYYDKLLTIFAYNHIIKKIIISLKYYHQTSNSKKIAAIFYDNFFTELQDFDFIIATPIHRQRLKIRGFNQSILIARHLAKMLNKKHIFNHKILVKTKNTNPQTTLRKKARINNLRNAFIVPKKYHNLIIDKKILLIDDVVTTGATINHCAKALKKAKIKKVAILSFAKNINI